MNCKQGDLAIIVRSPCGNEGAIVRCLKFRPQQTFLDTRTNTRSMADSWEVDRWFVGVDGRTGNVAMDANLRPIRDPGDDAVDEMVRGVSCARTRTGEVA